MEIISIVLFVVFVIACILLILMVMIQDEQGEGIGGLFGGGSSTPFGSRSGNVLTRFTSILAAVFLLTSLGLAWINRATEDSNIPGAAYRQTDDKAAVVEWWNTDTEESEEE